VVVLATLGTRPARRFARRRTREVEPEPSPSPVAIARATVIDAGEPFGDAAAAQAWLAGVGDGAQEQAGDALAVLNAVLRAHRAAAADAYARDVGAEQALAVRLGYGAGEQVADGRWAEALEVDLRPRRPRRLAALRPQERLAALLSGRDQALACEELVLRARVDLDEGRPREAALQVRVALEAALAELEPGASEPDMGQRIAELRERRESIGAAANEALHGPLQPASAEAVEEVVERLEAALRARAAAGPPTDPTGS
jgi:hypothetical protein